MTKKRLLNIVLLILKKLQDPYYQGVAAELAFFILLSLIPTIILLAQLLGVFSISIDVINEIIAQYVSPDMAETLSEFLVFKSPGAFNLLFVIFALWAASKAHFSMMRITNYSFSGGKSTGRGYIIERLRSIKAIVFTMFTIVFSLLILVYGEIIINLITSYVRAFLKGTFTFDTIWYILRWPMAMGLYFLMITYNYYILPSKRVEFKKILPGSILASLGMLLATWIYSYYVTAFANYDLLYGSLAAIVALLFWFYLLAFILVVGIMVNVAWEETK
ncbi:YihY/virulence factor BrkB family protein [Anaerovorax odorimutans]|uniref:YihY/virulence factor BrkB family protein n=1 Tax=Anaerovorax odorimutans TaxID=109327 RepID=UPI0003F6BB63|nr:YihY/virulence factor BrkB family protein [Anaerovorax odorimutans]